jgi:hypothetical protein
MTRRNTGRPRRMPPVVPQPRPEDTDPELIWLAMATPGGYQGPPAPQQFRGAGSRGKSYCRWCDLVMRGAGTCSYCGRAAVLMPKSWRPGRKGTRTRVWDVRVSRRRRQHSGPPDAVRQLGVRGLPPRSQAVLSWYVPDPVRQAIVRRGLAQRARYRRGRRS